MPSASHRSLSSVMLVAEVSYAQVPSLQPLAAACVGRRSADRAGPRCGCAASPSCRSALESEGRSARGLRTRPTLAGRSAVAGRAGPVCRALRRHAAPADASDAGGHRSRRHEHARFSRSALAGHPRLPGHHSLGRACRELRQGRQEAGRHEKIGTQGGAGHAPALRRQPLGTTPRCRRSGQDAPGARCRTQTGSRGRPQGL